jgi:hypothetical protein
MSEKKFRQLPIIDLSSDAIKEPISYIKTGLFHPKVVRHQLTTLKRSGKIGTAKSSKQIKMKNIMGRFKTPLKPEDFPLKQETPVIFDSINSYLNLHKLKTLPSPKNRCKTPNFFYNEGRHLHSLAVIKRLKFARKDSVLNGTTKDESFKEKKTEKIHVFISSPKIEV